MKDRYYEGQQVVITDNRNGHFHEIGEVVTLKSAYQTVNSTGETYWQLATQWFFTDSDCKPFKEEK